MSASSQNGLYAVCGSFMGLSTIAVSLRFYSRKVQKIPVGIDDWTALFSVVTYIGACACGIALAATGGYDYSPDPSVSAEVTAKLGIAYDWLNQNTLACTKLSALFFYRRVFVVSRHGLLNIVILVTAVIVLMWCITFDFLSIFQCHAHFTALWDGDFAKYCDLNPVWAKGLAASDLILDVWILIIPLPSIWNLHATTTRKFAIMGVFLLAFVSIGASIARAVYFYSLHAPGPQVLYVALLESGMSSTVINLPSIWHLCTSTIPSNIARSLHSLKSLSSGKSGKADPRSDPDTSQTISTQVRHQQAAKSLPANVIHVQTDLEVGNEIWQDASQSVTTD